MKYVKKFEDFRLNEAAPAAPPKPTIAPPITKPERPVKPGKPIERPSVDPQPKAVEPNTKSNKSGKPTAKDVADRFIDELQKRGEDIEKYINK
jgi:hypothetical protein